MRILFFLFFLVFFCILTLSFQSLGFQKNDGCNLKKQTNKQTKMMDRYIYAISPAKKNISATIIQEIVCSLLGIGFMDSNLSEINRIVLTRAQETKLCKDFKNKFQPFQPKFD